MTIATSKLAYDDCHKVLESAIETSKGIRMEMPSRDAAFYFRMRCHNYRAICRKENAKIYEPDHPLHGTCEYDKLVLPNPKLIDGVWYLYITKSDVVPGKIESLDEVGVPEVIHSPPRLIEGPKPEITEVLKITRRV